jgi:hypothetical protein
MYRYIRSRLIKAIPASFLLSLILFRPLRHGVVPRLVYGLCTGVNSVSPNKCGRQTNLLPYVPPDTAPAHCIYLYNLPRPFRYSRPSRFQSSSFYCLFFLPEHALPDNLSWIYGETNRPCCRFMPVYACCYLHSAPPHLSAGADLVSLFKSKKFLIPCSFSVHYQSKNHEHLTLLIFSQSLNLLVRFACLKSKLLPDGK